MKNSFKFLCVVILVGLMKQPFAAGDGTSSRLENLGKRYIQFMRDVGNLENEILYEDQATQLFTESVVKIVNGLTILSNRVALLAQLRDARAKAYPCVFDIKKILVDEQKKTCVISFTWNSEKLGLHTTMVFLKFDENGQITEIDEVYNAAGTHLNSSSKPIKDLAIAYSAFQNSYGQSEDKNYQEIIEGLFSPGFRKIANNAILVSNRDGLESQLGGVRVAAGKWTMKEKKTIPSADNKQCVIWYVLETEKMKSFDVMAILSSSDGNKIDLIDEIYYQIS